MFDSRKAMGLSESVVTGKVTHSDSRGISFSFYLGLNYVFCSFVIIVHISISKPKWIVKIHDQLRG